MDRILTLREVLQRLGVEAIITGNPYNRYYISGFTGSSGHVIISMDDAALITDYRYIEQVKMEAPEFTVVNNHRNANAAIHSYLKEIGVKRVAIEEDLISQSQFKNWENSFTGVTLIPTSGIFENMRMIKSDIEIAIIKEAVRIADDAFEHILPFMRPGVREIDLAIELETFIIKQGAKSVIPNFIVASGKRGALPHGTATDKVIELGEMVTMDFGALYKGYCSDITRTVAVGQPSTKMCEIYEIVLEAQCNMIENLKAGMTGQEVDLLGRNVINKAGYADYTHRASGHGFGLEIHEKPMIATSVDTDLIQKGMIITVEPGIYIPDFGGVRIEDDVLVTEQGCENLTRSTKELLILPF